MWWSKRKRVIFHLLNNTVLNLLLVLKGIYHNGGSLGVFFILWMDKILHQVVGGLSHSLQDFIHPNC